MSFNTFGQLRILECTVVLYHYAMCNERFPGGLICDIAIFVSLCCQDLVVTVLLLVVQKVHGYLITDMVSSIAYALNRIHIIPFLIKNNSWVSMNIRILFSYSACSLTFDWKRVFTRMYYSGSFTCELIYIFDSVLLDSLLKRMFWQSFICNVGFE